MFESYLYYNIQYKYFYVVHIIIWLAQKMPSATGLGSSQLVRIVGLCAQTRVAIEMHS